MFFLKPKRLDFNLKYLNKVCQKEWWVKNHDSVMKFAENIREAALKGEFSCVMCDIWHGGHNEYVAEALGFRVSSNMGLLRLSWRKPLPPMLPEGVDLKSASYFRSMTLESRNRFSVQDRSDKRFSRIYRDLQKAFPPGTGFRRSYPTPKGMTLPEFVVFRDRVVSESLPYHVTCELEGGHVVVSRISTRSTHDNTDQ